MMSRKRQNDVSDETVRKRSKFSGAMIKLGAYAAYSVIFLLKKLNRILCDSAKAFTSKTTALILGVIKKFKEIYPDIEVLPLDYDPDLSFANVENRLQMLIMNQKL